MVVDMKGVVEFMQAVAEKHGFDSMVVLVDPRAKEDDDTSMLTAVSEREGDDSLLHYLADVIDAVMKGRLIVKSVEAVDVH